MLESCCPEPLPDLGFYLLPWARIVAAGLETPDSCFLLSFHRLWTQVVPIALKDEG